MESKLSEAISECCSILGYFLEHFGENESNEKI